MGLHLSSHNVVRCRQLSETLLSPLEYPDVDQWCVAVLRRLEALFEADRSMFVLPVKASVQLRSESVPAETLAGFREAFSAIGQGRLSSPRPDVDRVFAARLREKLDVYNLASLGGAAGVSMKRLPFYNEVLVPAGVTAGVGMVASVAVGEAWLSVANSRPGSDQFGEENRLELLRLLLPAFKAGVSTVVNLDQRRENSADAFGALGQACVAFRCDGSELFRSAPLERLLAREPEHERLLTESHRLAASVLRLRGRPSKTTSSHAAPVAFRDLATARTRYELRAALVGPGVFDGNHVVIVTLERAHGRMSLGESMTVAVDLTRREADVLRCLTYGMRYKAVAHQLDISIDTVRTHIRNIYGKLQVHSVGEAVKRALNEGLV
jgi:DNA-binding CsgD family transcriptional regulator